MERRVIIFHGRVQGVGFRATAAEVAKRRAVTGWVRNEPDYSVRMEIQGEPAEIEAVLADLRTAMSRNILREDRLAGMLDTTETTFQVRR